MPLELIEGLKTSKRDGRDQITLMVTFWEARVGFKFYSPKNPKMVEISVIKIRIAVKFFDLQPSKMKLSVKLNMDMNVQNRPRNIFQKFWK